MGSGKLLTAFMRGHGGISSKILETITLETVRVLEEAGIGSKEINRFLQQPGRAGLAKTETVEIWERRLKFLRG